MRLLGDIGAAEDAVQDAYVQALRTWPDRGVPDVPGAWITTTARNRALDRIRREAARPDRERAAVAGGPPDELPEVHPVADDQLRLVFTCCHPALVPEARVALTLRLVCGLRTSEIARAFLQPEATVAQRLSRAKAKIRTAGIPFRVPPAPLLAERLPSVLTCAYLVFTEGYAATAGDDLVRRDLCAEGVRLARLLAELLPDEAEVHGLLALVLFQDARRAARTDADGGLVLLADQERSRWDTALVHEGLDHLERALRRNAMGVVVDPGRYGLEAAIAGAHATAPSWEATDWPRIAGLYGRLAQVAPSPVVELNRAVAVGHASGPAAGLAVLDAVAGDPRLARTHLLPAARADLLRRLGRAPEAAEEYRRALALVATAPERAFLTARLTDLGG